MKNFDYSVIYSDDDIVVLNKRSGILIAADRYDPDAPRLDLLAQKEFGKLYAVHRIDRDTTGLLVVCKNDAAHNFLADQLSVHSINRIYYCLVFGRLKEKEGTVDAPIARP